ATGWEVYVEHAFRLHPLLTAERRAERGDGVAGTLAASARLIDGEEALLEPELASALAAQAGLDVVGALGPAAAALLADLPSGDLETDFLAVDGVFKGETQAVLDVGAAGDPVPPLPPAEEVVEDVVEDVAEALPEPLKAMRSLGTANGARVTGL